MGVRGKSHEYLPKQMCAWVCDERVTNTCPNRFVLMVLNHRLLFQDFDSNILRSVSSSFFFFPFFFFLILCKGKTDQQIKEGVMSLDLVHNELTL